MRPAFTKITINDGSVSIEGPIDLDGTETDAYFWVRIMQEASGEEAEVVGRASTDRAELRQWFADASDRLVTKVTEMTAPAPGATTAGPLSAPSLAGAVLSATAMWGATFDTTETKNGTLAPGTADVEAWALVHAENPTREFHVYWKEAAVQVVAG
jgi:hypothetical protein